MPPLPLFLILALVSLQVTQTIQAKIDCKRFVFHPSCRGISAKRFNLQLENVNVIPLSENKRLVDSTDYSELEREETPELDISNHRRRVINHTTSTSTTPRFPSFNQRPYTHFSSKSTPTLAHTFSIMSSTVSTPTLPSVPSLRRNGVWNNDTSRIIPPRHSSFFLGVRKPQNVISDSKFLHHQPSFKHGHHHFSHSKHHWFSKGHSNDYFGKTSSKPI